MKKIIIAFILLGLVSSLSACAKDAPVSETLTREEITEKAETPKEERYPYDLSEYVTLPEPYGVSAKFDDPESLTQKELDEAILQIRLRLATFDEKIALVEKYSKVKLDYTVIWQGVELTDQAVQGAELVVGLESGDEMQDTLGISLLGFGIGNQCYVEYTFPQSVVHDDLAGQTVVIRAVLSEIYRAVLPEYNEKFIRSMEGYETYTVKEFETKLKKDLLAQKEENQRLAVWEAFCAGVTVHGYPEKEIKEYTEDFRSYYTSLAQGLKMDLEELVSTYMEMTMEEFEEETARYAEEMVKNDMIFTQLARTLEITLTDDEYRLGVERYYAAEETEFDSVTEFIKYYTEESIRENLIRDKAVMVLVENAIRIE